MKEMHMTQIFLHFEIRTENVFLAGSVPELGNWSPDNAIPLSPTNYPTWNGECWTLGFWGISLTRCGYTATVTLPGYTTVEYKYIKKNGNDVVWASDPNWTWKTPDAGSATLSDNWR